MVGADVRADEAVMDDDFRRNQDVVDGNGQGPDIATPRGLYAETLLAVAQAGSPEEVPEDRRVYQVVLTAKGASLLEKVLPHYEGAIQRIMKSIQTSEAKLLIEMMKKMELEAEKFNQGLK